MSFVPSDLYLTSGSAQLINAWQATVAKFDVSAFYNWEQDNLPLYDLEDRSEYLWEKVGYPVKDGFSGIPGACFVVSADAFTANFGLYSSVPGSVNSSSNVFRNLSSVIAVLPNPLTYPVLIEVASFGNLGELNIDGLQFRNNGGLEIVNRTFAKLFAASADFGIVGTFSSIDVQNTIIQSSALCISSLIMSSTTDSRWDSNHRLTLAASPFNPDTNKLTNAALMGIGAGADLADGDETINYSFYNDLVGGFNVIHGVSGGSLSRYAAGATDPITGFLYGNYLTKVNIKNCQNRSKLFIRNFCVDGLDTSTLNTGFQISNSELVIENCMALRCRKHGFQFNDSYVQINRGLVATYNYEVSGTTRISSSTAGLEANNSYIFVSGHQYGSGVDLVLRFNRNDIGVRLNNSIIEGGNSRSVSKSFSRAGTDTVSFLQAFGNRTGIELNNSKLFYNGRLDLFNNTINGLETRDSIIKIEECDIDINAQFGIQGFNSNIELNSAAYKFPASPDSEFIQQFTFDKNGQHLRLNDCCLQYKEVLNLPGNLGKTFFSENHLIVSSTSTNKTSLPALYFNNSQIDLLHARIKVVGDEDNFAHTRPVYGACVYSNGSNVRFKGSSQGVTYLTGPPTFGAQENVAAVYAKDSTLEFMGPTVIGQAAVDILGEGSIVSFLPHNKSQISDVSGWNLSNHLNHTRVELFATRACLVMDDSELYMNDLGSIQKGWPASELSSVDYDNANEFDLSAFTGSGYMQFYPNGQDSDAINASSNRHTLPVVAPFDTELTTTYLMFEHLGSPTNILGFSTGGMCVRALNGSFVRVNNVNFPTGWFNPSGAYYDSSALNSCERLYIWNFAGDSCFDAANLMVSGVYPNQVGYNGPSAVYQSAGIPASAAPSYVPDTGILSVLDDFGASAGVAGTNYGPFRLYFSVNGPAKYFFYQGGTLYNLPYQAWSQGYNPSGALSANNAVSSIYKDWDGRTIYGASSFFTTSSMLDGSFANRIRLDESAANTFANAKNAARKRSGRIPVVTIYKSKTEAGGEGFDTSVGGHGKGLLSVNIFDLKRTN